MAKYLDMPGLTYFYNQIKNKFASKSDVGKPFTANTIANMNKDKSKVYVYTGSESGMTFGDWYYYDDGEWHSGGQYHANVYETDKNLSAENVPADAKATGDKINTLQDGIFNAPVNIQFSTKQIYPNEGTFSSRSNYATIYAPVSPGVKYTIRRGIKASKFSVSFTEEMPASGVSYFNITANNSADYISVIAPENANYICAYIFNALADSELINQRSEIIASTTIEENQRTDKNLSINNAPADAKAVGDRIDEFEEGLKRNTELLFPYNIQTIWTQGSINDDSGGNDTSTNYLRSSYFRCLNGVKITVSSGYKARVGVYNQGGGSNNFICWLDDSEWNGEKYYQNPSGFDMRIRLRKDPMLEITTDEGNDNVSIIRYQTDSTLSAEYVPADAKAVGDEIAELKRATFQTVVNIPFSAKQLSPSSGVFSARSNYAVLCAPVFPGTKYTVRREIKSSRFSVMFTEVVPASGVDYFNVTTDNDADYIDAVAPENANYICAYILNALTDPDLVNQRAELIASTTIEEERRSDNTLSINNAPADAKIVGDEIEKLKSTMYYNYVPTWIIGSLGSHGENYNPRKYEIRTAEYILVNDIQSITFDEPFNCRFCVYDTSRTLLNRYTYNSVSSIDISAIKDDYPAAYYCRFTMYTDDTTELVDTSMSEHVSILFPVNRKIEAYINEQETTNLNKYNDLILQARYSYANTDSGIDANPRVLTLLQLTDVHDDFDAMLYALKVYDIYSDKIDDIIHTGDAVRANFSDGIANWIASGCAEKVLNVIGNHDTEEQLVLQAAGKDNVYNTFFAPYISEWGVTQPAGVDDSSSADYHALYYYKDYTAPKIRLIILDTNFWDSAEETWLTNVLADAKTKQYAVLIACHDVKKLTEMTQSNFSAYLGDGINETNNAYGNQPDDWLDCVQDYIDNGGDFICILAGHNHSGHIGTMTNYPDIFVYVADKSSMDRVTGTARTLSDENQNTVSVVTVNAKEKLFKLVKIGAEVDGKMRGKHVFCYNYATKTIISQW